MAAGFWDLYRRLRGWWGGRSGPPRVYDYVDVPYSVTDHVDSP